MNNTEISQLENLTLENQDLSEEELEIISGGALATAAFLGVLGAGTAFQYFSDRDFIRKGFKDTVNNIKSKFSKKK